LEDDALGGYSREASTEALRAITPAIGKCEKAQLKLLAGTPQSTLAMGWVKACGLRRK
jgi:hypothetical protein